MAHPPETKTAVRTAYVRERLPLDEAATRSGVPVDTARKWKRAAESGGDDWDKARAAHSLTQAGTGAIVQLVLADYLALHQATVEGLREDASIPALSRAEAMSRLADAFTKTMAAAAKAAPELGRFAVASELLADLAGFVRNRFPAHAGALAEILEPFALEMARKYG